MIKDLDSFYVTTNNGIVLRVSVIRGPRIDTSTLAGKSSIPNPLAELRLDDGGHINYIDEETFLIVETGELVKRKH